MDYLDKDKRKIFAAEIVDKADLSGTFEGNKFIEHFIQLEGITLSETEQKKILEWIEYKRKADVRKLIKHDYDSMGGAKKVLDFCLEKN